MRTRPARDSLIVGTVRKLVEPVSRNRPGSRVGVHEPLDGSDHPVAAELYLVDRQRAASSGEEGQRIGQGRLPLRIVVERNVLTAPLLGYQPGKGCLSALTGPVQDDRAKSIERFAEAGPEVPADQFHKSNYSP